MPVTAPADRRFRRPHVKPARRRRSWVAHARIVAQVVGSVGVFAGGGYVVAEQVAGAESLHVSRIVVRGNERLPGGEVKALVAGLEGRHVLEVDLEDWRRRVLGSAWVERASLRRILPSTVEIVVEERRPIAIGRIGGELYLVDATGHVIDEYGPNYAQFDLPIVDGLGSTPPGGQPLVDESRAGLAHALIEQLRPHEALYRRLSQIDVSNSRDAVVVLQDDSTLLHLGRERFAERLQSYVDLTPALREQVPEMEYVDLRFGDRFYVRPAGAGRRRSAGR